MHMDSTKLDFLMPLPTMEPNEGRLNAGAGLHPTAPGIVGKVNVTIAWCVQDQVS